MVVCFSMHMKTCWICAIGNILRKHHKQEKSHSRIVPCLFAIFVIVGCTSTKVIDHQILVNEKITRPDLILVYDFVATTADMPADSTLADQYSDHSKPQTAEQIEIGRKLGAQIAEELVEEIRARGIPAERDPKGATAQINDVLIRGYFISVNKGSEAKRFAIGFGSGASELKTVVEVYQMTAMRLRKLSFAETDASGGKTSGAAVGLTTLVAKLNPLSLIVSTGIKLYGAKSGNAKIEGRAKQTAKKIADHIKIKFEQEGWIK
jgi:hypothetical protein